MVEDKKDPQVVFPWNYDKPRPDGTPFIPVLGNNQERALAGLSAAVIRSEGIITYAVERQKALLRTSAKLLDSQGFIPEIEVIIDGEVSRQKLFFGKDIIGICVDPDGEIKFYHTPKDQPDIPVIDTKTTADSIAVLAFAPKLIRTMEEFNRKTVASARKG